MSNQSRITDEQLAILNQFTCERLTAHPENLRLTYSFYCRRNIGLSRKLQDDAWYEDREGLPVVYYVIKNPQGKIAMYFSLKCGVLFNPNYVRDVMERYDRSRELVNALENRESKDWAREHLEELRSGYGFIPYDDKMGIRYGYKEAREAKRYILGDEKVEPNRKMIRVDEAFPAIELVHFCVNDWARQDWNAYNMGHSMGEVMFWHFVVPKMLQINALIGCEYAYLFAADGTKDGTLINYYETTLHFECLKNIGAIKPQYDFYCVFMGKRLFRLSQFRKYALDPSLYDDEDPLGLDDYRKDFFENFNLIPGDDMV